MTPEKIVEMFTVLMISSMVLGPIAFALDGFSLKQTQTQQEQAQ